MVLDLERLQELADIFGGDLARWPAGEREAAASMLQASGPARAIVAEARALDAALAAAPQVDPRRHAAIADRIMAEISSEPRREAPAGARPGAAVVALPRRSGVPVPASGLASRRMPVMPPPARAWAAAGALAASLAIGVLIGSLDLAPASMQPLVELAASDSDVTHLAAALGSDGVFTTPLDEEQL